MVPLLDTPEVESRVALPTERHLLFHFCRPLPRSDPRLFVLQARMAVFHMRQFEAPSCYSCLVGNSDSRSRTWTAPLRSRPMRNWSFIFNPPLLKGFLPSSINGVYGDGRKNNWILLRTKKNREKLANLVAVVSCQQRQLSGVLRGNVHSETDQSFTSGTQIIKEVKGIALWRPNHPASTLGCGDLRVWLCNKANTKYIRSVDIKHSGVNRSHSYSSKGGIFQNNHNHNDYLNRFREREGAR